MAKALEVARGLKSGYWGYRKTYLSRIDQETPASAIKRLIKLPQEAGSKYTFKDPDLFEWSEFSEVPE